MILKDTGSEQEQITRATIGGGTISVGGKELADGDPTLAGLNRDVDNMQEITKDMKTGALDGTATIDNRMLSTDGWENIINQHEDLIDNIEQIGNGLRNNIVVKSIENAITDEKISLIQAVLDGVVVGAVAGSVVAAVGNMLDRIFNGDDDENPNLNIPTPMNPNAGNGNPDQQNTREFPSGSLSEKYESSGRGPGTINAKKENGEYIFDVNGNLIINSKDDGGLSYGVWQIATETGTMNSYLTFLEQNYNDFYRILNDAGGNNGAKQGTRDFAEAWLRLANDNSALFRESQHTFIANTHYLPVENFLNNNYSGLNFDNRNPVVRNVLWSTSVQHSYDGNIIIINNAFGNKDFANMTDADIINGIYDARINYVNGFTYWTPAQKAKEIARYADERQVALSKL